MCKIVGKQYFLKDGCALQVIGDDFRFIGKTGQLVPIKQPSPSCKVILKHLLESHPRKITYTDLYDTYGKLYGKVKEEDGFDPAKVLSDLKGTLDPQIRPYIKAWFDKDSNTRGYHIPGIDSIRNLSVGSSPNSVLIDMEPNSRLAEFADIKTVPSELKDLAGEYFALFPNPDAHSEEIQMLGAYFHITSCNDGMKVRAIIGIQNNDELLKASTLFSNDDYSSSLKMISKKYRKYWFEGTLKKSSEYVAVISLKSGIDNIHWNIVLDIKDFMCDTSRSRIEDKDKYRAGLGILLGGWTDWGIAAFRMALIRKVWFDFDAMGMGSQEMKEWLRTTNYVNTTSDLDQRFYRWVLANGPDFDQDRC